MKIDFSQVYQYTVSLFKNVDLSAISATQKNILIVATAALGLIAACFAIKRYFFSPKDTSSSLKTKTVIDLTQKPNDESKTSKTTKGDDPKPKPPVIPVLPPLEQEIKKPEPKKDELKDKDEHPAKDESSSQNEEGLKKDTLFSETHKASKTTLDPSQLQIVPYKPPTHQKIVEFVPGIENLKFEPLKIPAPVPAQDLSKLQIVPFFIDPVQKVASYVEKTKGKEFEKEILFSETHKASMDPSQLQMVPYQGQPIPLPTVLLLSSRIDHLILEPSRIPTLIPKTADQDLSQWTIVPFINPDEKIQSPDTEKEIILVKEEESIETTQSWYGWLKDATIKTGHKIADTSYSVFSVAKEGAKEGAKLGVALLATGVVIGVQAYRAEKKFVQGIDLEPYFMDGYQKGHTGVVGLKSAIQQWYDAPSTEYDPLTANLIQGFSKEFGGKFHYLLLNAARVGGPELAGQLGQMLDITNMVGESIGNSFLKISNPLGWASIFPVLANLGVDCAGIFKVSVLTRLEDDVDQFIVDLAKKSGSEKLVKHLQLEISHERAQQSFKKEFTAFIEDLKSKGITGGASDWFVDYEEGYATSEYKKAKEALYLATDALNNFEQPDLVTKAKLRALGDLSAFLKNTAKQTLGHFVNDINEVVASNTQISEENKKIMQDGLNLVVLGHYRFKDLNAPILYGTPQKFAKVVTEVKDNPTRFITKLIPTTVKETAKIITKPINNAVGNFLGQAVIISMDTEVINKLGLKNLNLFDEDQLKFDVNPYVQNYEGFSDEFKEQMGEVLKECESDVNLYLQQLIQRAGKEVGSMFSLGIASSLENVCKENGYTYTAQELMSKEIEHSMLAQIGGKTLKFMGITGFKVAKTVYQMPQTLKALFDPLASKEINLDLV